MECPVLKECPFFNSKLKNMPSTANLLKKNYCLKDYTKCARWKVREKLGPDGVPEDMFPNDHSRAEKYL